MRARKAFTVIELAAVIGLLGLLIAIVLCAVQAARESARRLECVSHLRQIGIALNNYCSSVGVFPAAYMGGSRKPGTDGYYRSFPYSPFARILPQLDQQAVFSSINFDVKGIADDNGTAASTTLGVFLCPTDRSPDASSQGPTNYRVNTGSGVQVDPYVMKPTEAGAFEAFRCVSPSSFTDGLSHTALVSEKLRGDLDPVHWDPVRDFWFADCNSSPTDSVVNRCTAGAPGAFHNSFGGRYWMYSDFSNTFYNHAVEPNWQHADCSTKTPGWGEYGGAGTGIFTARSEHGAGVHLGMADGSVRWTGSKISVSVWRAFGTRAGREILPDGSAD